MRSTLLLFLMSPLMAMAQSWAPIGATWTYKQGSCCGPDTNLAVIESVGDTVIDGQVCRRLEMYEGWSVCYEHVRHFHESSDSLWYWDDVHEQFELLFRWNAMPGDGWWTRVGGSLGGPIDTLDWNVLDTGHVVIAGITLKTWSVEVIPRQWNMIAPIALVTERLGPGHSPFTWVFGACDAETFTQLRCYEDNDITWQNPSASQCALSTGMAALHDPPLFSLNPNPVAAGEPAFLEFHGSATSMDMLVHDALGREVLRTNLKDTRTPLVLPSSGVFVVTLHQAGSPLAQQRLVVR